MNDLTTLPSWHSRQDVLPRHYCQLKGCIAPTYNRTRIVTVTHDIDASQTIDRNVKDGTYTYTATYDDGINKKENNKIVFESRSAAIAQLLQQVVVEHIHEEKELLDVLTAFVEIMLSKIVP